MHPTLTIARRAAISAGKVILRHYENLDRINISAKRHNDLVSEVDLQAEREIVQTLRRSYPDHAMLCEESGLLEGDAEHQWLIDPLDGTTNYLHGLPLFCVSIAYRQRGRLESGLIYDPLRDEFFTASRGGGAQLDDRRIRVTQRPGLEGALLSAGLPPWKIDRQQAFLTVCSDLMQQGGMLRRTGSAALDLAYVACGRLDGFWEMGLNPWDIGAGALLVQEAGGLVGDFAGGHEHLSSGNVVTGNPKVFKALLKTIHPHIGALTGPGASG
jgi:myo-inositol-1(or 4)-monophosphatase